MALKWVRDNIKYFGGDPQKVTIGGMNSGAASVQLHMMSPMSQGRYFKRFNNIFIFSFLYNIFSGLFRAGLEQSGTSLNPWVMQYNPKEIAFQLGTVLGIQTTDSKELVDKLKMFSAKELMVAAEKVSKSTYVNNFLCNGEIVKLMYA